MMCRLPIGAQSFESIRRDGYVYVDKTAFVYRLVSEGKPYFLSRPRRFGKSLLLSTLRAYLEGKRSLFGGLAIERLEAEGAAEEGREPWVARPVFHLDFNSGNYTAAGELEKKLDATLRDWEDTWQTQRRDGTLGDRFLRTLQQAHAQSGHRVAVLVDEYDKPLLECMDNPALEERNRACLKGFYGALKPADEHLRRAARAQRRGGVGPHGEPPARLRASLQRGARHRRAHPLRSC